MMHQGAPLGWFVKSFTEGMGSEYTVLSVLLAVNLLAALFFLLNGGWRQGWMPLFIHLTCAGFSLVLIYIVFLLSELHYKMDDLMKQKTK